MDRYFEYIRTICIRILHTFSCEHSCFTFRTLKYSYTITSSSFVNIQRRSKETAYRRRKEKKIKSYQSQGKCRNKVLMHEFVFSPKTQ